MRLKKFSKLCGTVFRGKFRPKVRPRNVHYALFISVRMHATWLCLTRDCRNVRKLYFTKVVALSLATFDTPVGQCAGKEVFDSLVLSSITIALYMLAITYFTSCKDIHFYSGPFSLWPHQYKLAIILLTVSNRNILPYSSLRINLPLTSLHFFWFSLHNLGHTSNPQLPSPVAFLYVIIRRSSHEWRLLWKMA